MVTTWPFLPSFSPSHDSQFSLQFHILHMLPIHTDRINKHTFSVSYKIEDLYDPPQNISEIKTLLICKMQYEDKKNY